MAAALVAVLLIVGNGGCQFIYSFNVSGIVTDANGVPLEGVSVKA